MELDFIKIKVMELDLNKEMAWVTFLDDGWETKWHPVLDDSGKQLEWGLHGEGIMELCRSRFNVKDNWISFGIAQTSQMVVKNSVRDNM